MSITNIQLFGVSLFSRHSALVGLLLISAVFRISVAHWFPSDAPDDGRVYAQMARNLLEQHVFSHDGQPPYQPSLIRLPGYPLFLAGIYSIFGHTSNGAVRIIQALIDTATCGLIALLAFYWQPDEKKKRASAIAALALAAVCPFTTIYAVTILTEVPTNFLVMAMLVAVTLGFRKLTTEDTEAGSKRKLRRAIAWWAIAGLIGGVAVLMRPDSGLFLAAVGITLVITGVRVPTLVGLFRRKSPTKVGTLTPRNIRQIILSGCAFSLAFVLLLTPWTIRNWRVFHLFQPLAPAHGEMPGEFVPRGYQAWVRTWLDDESYIAPFLWSLDTDPIDVDDLPPQAFDSPEEEKRVATLFEAYNNQSDSEASQNEQPAQPQSTPNPQPSPSPSPSVKAILKSSQPQKQTTQNSNANKAANENDNSEASDEGDDESDEENKSAQPNQGEVEMTPEIDAAFGQLARERIARHPFRYYVVLPLKRARTMWFDTHSQYWPFEGTLLPFEDLDYDAHQHIWLPLFAALTAIYTVLGLIGAWLLLESRKLGSRRWLLLVLLAIVFRLVLFSSMENPEPRYLVEFFPILAVLGGIAIGHARRRLATDEHR